MEVVEQACGMATYQMGEMAENVSTGIDSYSIRQPLGVTAGICPFNFPAMIPLWMFPVAVTAGNTMVRPAVTATSHLTLTPHLTSHILPAHSGP